MENYTSYTNYNFTDDSTYDSVEFVIKMKRKVNHNFFIDFSFNFYLDSGLTMV